MTSYLDRKPTRYEHQGQIIRAYDLMPFAEVEAKLVAWIADQAWMIGDGVKALLTGAVAWLRERNALLTGITTLERLVSEGKQAADTRLWAHGFGPESLDVIDYWDQLLTFVARMHQSWVVFVNRVGDEDGTRFWADHG
ncbi:DUF4158 domain-containing protein [Nocardia tengchongensis]|uniref:DUF4158 domain-containing protein n=2 Tax=Nocardia tengchongensis TaxID=2055889 RepID=UPI0036998A50